MRTLALSMVLLCVFSTVVWVQSEGMVMKLCGREFIRAVTYICGASRWRRLLQEQELNGVVSQDKGQCNRTRTSPSRRDLNKVLSNMCCQVGCDKSILTFLC